MNYAVLLSGGTGNRINTDVPKQYVRVGNGKETFSPMMVTYALKPLLLNANIDYVFIVANNEWRDSIITDVTEAGLDDSKIAGFADPGANRQSSIFSGINEIILSHYDCISSVRDSDTVLVHDAARPFLTDQMVNACYEALSGHDGVMPVLPMKDTV